MVPNVPTPVMLTALNNRTFTFETKTPPTTWFLKRCAGVDKGSPNPGREFVGTVSVKDVYVVTLPNLCAVSASALALPRAASRVISLATGVGGV